MTRQITIAHNDQHQLYDISFERREHATIYHIAPNVHSNVSFPREFEIIKNDDSDQPQYDTQNLNEENKEIADALWKQISLLPPQFSGGK